MGKDEPGGTGDLKRLREELDEDEDGNEIPRNGNRGGGKRQKQAGQEKRAAQLGRKSVDKEVFRKQQGSKGQQQWSR